MYDLSISYQNKFLHELETTMKEFGFDEKIAKTYKVKIAEITGELTQEYMDFVKKATIEELGKLLHIVDVHFDLRG